MHKSEIWNQYNRPKNLKVWRPQVVSSALCPITVRKSMEKVPGVKRVEVDYEMKIATVIFDPALTSKKQIADASTDIGYPASILADIVE